MGGVAVLQNQTKTGTTILIQLTLLIPLPHHPRLLQRELDKCLRLVSSLPMDMEEYFGKEI
jgi:hypothetical protein